jgi:hypothetical protein
MKKRMRKRIWIVIKKEEKKAKKMIYTRLRKRNKEEKLRMKMIQMRMLKLKSMNQ